MDRDELNKLYDSEYADAYEDRFLNSDITKSDRDFELRLIHGLLNQPDGSWLDCACGTGYFLSQFPAAKRMGIDLSPGMLQRAAKKNPDMPLQRWDLRDPNPEWRDRWDLVTCMWYAYGYVDTLREVVGVMDNLADWTAPSGSLLLPVADPRLIARAPLPYHTDDTPWEGEVHVEGIIWSYTEADTTKVHLHQIAPSHEFLTDALSRHFGKVEKLAYPPALPGWKDSRSALLATEKRETPLPVTPRFSARR